MRKLMSALMACSLILGAAHFTPAFAQETKIVRSISISGHGEVKAVPDLTSISMGVASMAETARAACGDRARPRPAPHRCTVSPYRRGSVHAGAVVHRSR